MPYGESILKLTKDTFLKLANWVLETATDRIMIQHAVCTAPAPSRAMQYANDGSYFPGNEAAESEKQQNLRKNNVKFYRTVSPSSTTSFRSYQLIAAKAMRNLKYGNKLSVDYGSNYEFK